MDVAMSSKNEAVRSSRVSSLLRTLNAEYALPDGPPPQIVEVARPLRVSRSHKQEMVEKLNDVRAVAKPGVRVHWLIDATNIHIMRSLPGSSRSETIGFERRVYVENGEGYGLSSLIAGLVSLDRLYDHDPLTAELVAATTLMGHVNHSTTHVAPVLVDEYLTYAIRNCKVMPEIEARPFIFRMGGIISGAKSGL